MYASQFVSDAAVSPPQPPRGGFGLQPSDEKPAERRKAGLIATLRDIFAAHAPDQRPSSRP